MAQAYVEKIPSLPVSELLLFFVEANGDFLPFNSGPAKSLDDAMDMLFRHFDQRELIGDFDGANHIRTDPGLVGNGTDEISCANPCHSTGVHMQGRHVCGLTVTFPSADRPATTTSASEDSWSIWVIGRSSPWPSGRLGCVRCPVPYRRNVLFDSITRL